MSPRAAKPKAKARKAAPRRRLATAQDAAQVIAPYEFPEPPEVAGYDSMRDSAGCWWDRESAERACQFFPDCLRFINGLRPREPYYLPPWQAAATALLFGWKRADGSRRYREAMVLVPRKNAKTTWLAGIALYMLLADGEVGPQVVIAAKVKKQALELYDSAVGMLRQGELWDEVTEYRSAQRLVLKDDPAGRMWAVTGDALSLHGLNIHGCFIDELHTQRNRALYEALTSASGARRQPLAVLISTADYSRDSLCNQKAAYARMVRDGAVPDSTFLPVLFEATPDEDWHDPKIWARVNPNMVISMPPGYIEREHAKAVMDPQQENTFRRLHLNQPTDQDKRWLPMDKWKLCERETPDADLAGHLCYAGLDLSLTNDMTSLALYWPHCHALRVWFWLPAATIAKRPEYQAWHRQGFLSQTPGNVVDFSFIESQILESHKRYKIAAVAYDPWNATQLATELRETHGVNMLECRQGFATMGEPTKQFERLVLGGELRAAPNKVLYWHAGNATVVADPAGNIKPAKPTGSEKIDGIVASIMAKAAASLAPKPKPAPRITVLGG